MKTFSTSFERKDSIEFIIDDDREMKWISSFDSTNYERFFVVIDNNVKKEWGEKVVALLKEHKKEIFIFDADATEKTKSLSFYPELVSFLEKNKCNLSDIVIAAGGGVIIDLVSFPCSTYMRALPFFVIATTLIGMTDASTAGKTCLNTKESKNLLGTFYYPKTVYSNIHFLSTYSLYHHRQGLSEAFKYGLLGSAELVETLKDYIKTKSDAALTKMIQLAAETRIAIRKKDPLASNLGHTFGHAIEKISGFSILHGDAISAGTALSLYFAEQEGILGKNVREAIIALMKSLKLNLYIDESFDVDAWTEAMSRDKKSSSTGINLVLLTGLQQPYQKGGIPFYRTTKEKVKAFLQKMMKEYPYRIEGCAGKIKVEIAYDNWS